MPKRVLFLIESLAGGGAEKVLATLVQHIDISRFDVTVCTISGGGRYEQEVRNAVNYTSVLKDASEYRGLAKLWYVLKYKLIYQWLPMWLVYRLFIPKGYDVEIAFVEGLATKLLAHSSNKNAKKISWVHIDLQQKPWPLEQGIYRNFEEEKSSYRSYDRVVCVSKSVEAVMRDYYRLDTTQTIYNPLDARQILSMGDEKDDWSINPECFNIVSVGRLMPQKGYDQLLPVITRLLTDKRRIHLWLIGQGGEEVSLRQQAKEQGISDHVTFTGFLKNPYALMSKMDLFVCSSRAEGFSLVIAESMILGVPVISMNCSGPNELIGKNEYGILCDTYEQLEEEIAAVIDGKKIPCSIPPMVDLQHTMNEVHHLLDS